MAKRKNKILKKVAKQLRGASKMHAAQAARIDKALKEGKKRAKKKKKEEEGIAKTIFSTKR